MTITYMIPGVPLINHLNEKTSDGQPDENARMNCVFASNAALATAYLHKAFNGDQLKDMDPKYGQGYTGGASEANLVDTMARLGIKVARVAHDTQQQLIDEIHWHVPKGHGVIVTMPSQWNSAVDNAGSSWNPRTYSGPSHVGLACGVGAGEIRVMNPWGGFWHDGSDAYWAARLLDGAVWVGEYVGTQGGSIMAGIPQGWKDDGKTLVAPNGVPVVRGMREYVLAHSWEADNLPLAPEAQLDSIEPGNSHIGPGARQDFRYRSLGCQHHSDGTWGQVYRIWVGQDVIALTHQLAAANAHIAELEAQIKTLQNSQPPTPVQQPPDPKAVEALVELAKALSLVAGGMAA